MFSQALVLFGLATVVLSAVAKEPVAVTSAKFDSSPDGSFEWSYESADGSSQQQEGRQINDGQAVQGVAQWVDPEGAPHVLQYVADQDGYKPSSADLPVAPPIPEAIARSIEWNAAHPNENLGMPAKPRAWQTLDEPKCGKPVKITVWKNQDFDCPGQEITLHPKFLKSWTGTLGLLTCVLQPRFGAVRKLYHLDTKKLVLCLKEIRPNGKYVAVGAEKVKFRKNGYVDESKMKRRPSKHDYSISISDLNLIACTKRNKRTLLYIMVSGRACQLPSKVVLIERDLMDYDMVLDYLGHRLDVGEGIQYLCSIDGKPIHDPSDLLHGQLYVAVPHASSFIQLDYLDLFSNLLPSIRLKAAKPKRSKSQQARSEEDIDKTGVDGNSQQEGELSKIASQTSKQASRSQEHSKGECELQEIDGKMSKSGAKASKSIS
ncbi:hypothetical protein YQE_10653, partial [Dendroctonus ponderosae]